MKSEESKEVELNDNDKIKIRQLTESINNLKRELGGIIVEALGYEYVEYDIFVDYNPETAKVCEEIYRECGYTQPITIVVPLSVDKPVYVKPIGIYKDPPGACYPWEGHGTIVDTILDPP